MRGLATYLLAGILTVTAMDFVAPPGGLGFAVGGWPTIAHGTAATTPDASMQQVDRTRKGDRLNPRQSIVGKSRIPEPPPPILRGCEPAFSTLTASAGAGNFARHCVAWMGQERTQG